MKSSPTKANKVMMNSSAKVVKRCQTDETSASKTAKDERNAEMRGTKAETKAETRETKAEKSEMKAERPDDEL